MISNRLWPTAWPISLKVPLLVACLMVAVSALVSERVLTRLAQMQQDNLEGLAATYLDGLSSSLLPHVLREDVWEVFDILDRSRGRDVGLQPVRTVVANGDGRVLAASDPRWHPVKSELPASFRQQYPEGHGLKIAEDASRAYTRRLMVHQGREIGTIFAEIDIAPLLAERREVLATLLITNIILTLGLAAVGYFAVRRMLRPVRVLAQHLDRGRKGEVEPIGEPLIQQAGGEFRRLFRRYNAMADAVNERRALADRLAEEEKLASLGRLTSGMAHEINNPLGGMLNAVDAMRRHGQQASVRERSIRLLEQGLKGIRDVVRAALMTYRNQSELRPISKSDIDDLRLLIKPELRRKNLQLVWENEVDGEIAVPASAVRQAALNLLLNACAAAPEGSVVSMRAELDRRELKLAVADRGPGLPDHFRSYLESANASSIPIEDNAGLGLWMIRRLADEIGGQISVERPETGGTVIRLCVPLQHEGLRDVA